MGRSTIAELRLTGFKSFDGQVLPLSSTAALIGRNGSGKSNALDGLEVLARLAAGLDVREALDGQPGLPGVRGGAAGCAPHGMDRFILGCKVIDDRSGYEYEYEVSIQVAPDVRVVGESLFGPARAVKSGKVTPGYLFKTVSASDIATAVRAQLHSGKRGANSTEDYRDNRVLLTQVPLRTNPTNGAQRSILEACEAVRSALAGVFHLDPVPHLMRSYVRRQDDSLQRTSANISAAVARIREADPETLSRLVNLLGGVSDLPIIDVDVVDTALGDVQMVIRERVGERVEVTPAREMSDGLLRFTAIGTALLTSTTGLDVDTTTGPRESSPSVTLVIEEIENGLHPAQAERVLRLITETTAELGTQVLVTTHSPALLNVVTGELSRSVVVCYRDRQTGKSMLSRIIDLPGYARAMTLGKLGDVVTQGRLAGPEVAEPDFDGFLRSLESSA